MSILKRTLEPLVPLRQKVPVAYCAGAGADAEALAASRPVTLGEIEQRHVTDPVAEFLHVGRPAAVASPRVDAIVVSR